jgi:hypothetical protein
MDGVDPHGIGVHVGHPLDPLGVDGRVGELARVATRKGRAQVHALDVERHPSAFGPYLEAIAGCPRRVGQAVGQDQRGASGLGPERRAAQPRQVLERGGVLRSELGHAGKRALGALQIRAPPRHEAQPGEGIDVVRLGGDDRRPESDGLVEIVGPERDVRQPRPSVVVGRAEGERGFEAGPRGAHVASGVGAPSGLGVGAGPDGADIRNGLRGTSERERPE